LLSTRRPSDTHVARYGVNALTPTEVVEGVEAMAEDKAPEPLVNVLAFPEDKMEEVVAALKPILLGDQGDQSPVIADIPGVGTGCTRTAATGSSDWSCSDAVALR
jgi:hypothetical protein